MSITRDLNKSNRKHFSLTTYEKITSSPSHAKYTFSKAERFPKIKQANNVNAYDVPDALNKRSTGMGYGTKEIFRHRAVSPSPDKYELGSLFDFKDQASRTSSLHQKKKSFCFGAGREDFRKTVVNTNTMYPDAIVPCPGSYTDQTTLIGVNARKTSLKERKFYMDVERTARKRAVPGPGTYEDTLALHKTGQYVSSMMGNSKATRLGKDERFKTYDQNGPGPGTYNETGNVAVRTQVCSNFHSIKTKNIGTTEKRTQWGGNPRFRTPGPGEYRPPSDFGYLDFKNQLREQQAMLGDKSVFTGYDTSQVEAANPSLQLDMHAISVQSERRPQIRGNSIYKTVEVTEPHSSRLMEKKGSFARNNQNSSRQNAIAHESTLYSMNQSDASPTALRSKQTPTTMNFGMSPRRSNDISPQEKRKTKTPQARGGFTAKEIQKKLKKVKRDSVLRDMVFVYADSGTKHQLRQEAAAMRARQQQDESAAQQLGSVDIENQNRNVSEMGQKPNSNMPQIVQEKQQ